MVSSTPQASHSQMAILPMMASLQRGQHIGKVTRTSSLPALKPEPPRTNGSLSFKPARGSALVVAWIEARIQLS